MSERRRERERRMKRKSTAADWREVRRWTGVWPLMKGSDWAIFGPSQFFMVVWPSAVRPSQNVVGYFFWGFMI